MTQTNRQRLAAILAADGVSYSLLMARNPIMTLESLDSARTAFTSAILGQGGRVVDMAGDSILAVFDTASGAMKAALDAQRVVEALAAEADESTRLHFRIGLHLGDVLEKYDGSVYGDGVNIASRLQALAAPGGIVVSEAIRGSVRHVTASFHDLGSQEVKNIPDPIRAFRVGSRPSFEASKVLQRWAKFVLEPARRSPVRTGIVALSFLIGVLGAVWQLHSLPNNRLAASPAPKSIAVLPFVNMTADKEQEYFSDGLADEMIDMLAKLPDLQVIARSSSFAFKGNGEDSTSIARKLHVANLLEGSIRRSGSRLRITTTLVRGSTGQTVWSETYEREIQDIFKVQDEIAAAVISSLKIKLVSTVTSGPRTSTDVNAYVQYLLGREHQSDSNVAGYRAAAAAYKRAIDIDQRFAAAHAGLSICTFQIADENNDSEMFARAAAEADKAIDLDPGAPDGYYSRAYYLYRREWKWSDATSDFQRALAISPGDGPFNREYGMLLLTTGKISDAIRTERKAVELDPLSGDAWSYLARMHFAAGSLEDGRRAAYRALELQPKSSRALTVSAISDLLQGQAAEARRKFERNDDAGVRLTGIAMAESSLGHDVESSKNLAEAIAQAGSDSAYQIAEAHAWRGDLDRAFDWLERSLVQRDPGLTLLKTDPLLKPLRNDPRLDSFLTRMNLR